MLGALFSFIIVSIILWYIKLMKTFKKFVKTNVEFSRKQFFCLLLLNFLVIGFAFWIILMPISELSSIDEEIWAISSFVISLIIAIVGDYLIYRKYATKQQPTFVTLIPQSEPEEDETANLNAPISSKKIISNSKLKNYDLFKLSINILLGILGCSALVISIIYFAICIDYMFQGNTTAIVMWLITSLVAGGVVYLWYYLNKLHITANKILGVIFFTLGIASCISPLFSVASLYVAAMLLKNIFSHAEDEEIIIFTESTIKKEWPLREFVKTYGPKIKLATLFNRDNNQHFKAIMVGDDDNWIMIKFSQDQPTLSAQEVAQQANDLKVVLSDTGEHMLYRI